MASVALVTSSMSPVDGTYDGMAGASASTSRRCRRRRSSSNKQKQHHHTQYSPLVGCSSVSHRTNTKATAAAASRPRRAELPGTAWGHLRTRVHWSLQSRTPRSSRLTNNINQAWKPT